MAATPVNALVKLSPTRRRMASSLRNLLGIIANSDSKLYNANPARVFLPIFPTTDQALQDALLLIDARLVDVLFPTR